MTREEQKELAETICRCLTRDILEKVSKIPDNWNGLEIRQWIYDYYAAHYLVPLKGYYLKEYKNSILVKNLT